MYLKLGRNHPSTITAPLTAILRGLFLFKEFLDTIFLSTTFILVILAILLIYSLMNSNTEEKTYEFGMLRALGMKHDNLVTLLILQSLFYAVPALVIAMVLAYTLDMMLVYIIANYATVAPDYNLPRSSIALGITIALVLPLISNIVPIQRALSKTLRDSLNVYHRTVSELTVKILKLAELGISSA